MNDESASGKIRVALAGAPNCGKTTIFNGLTGEKRAVGNYSGVTVDTVVGTFERSGYEFEISDLPGVYSLTTFSRDEQVARDYLLRNKVDVVVNVVDASNLERNLFLTLQWLELGFPVVVVLNMCDLAHSRGLNYNASRLSEILGARVVEVVGPTGQGFDELVGAIVESFKTPDQSNELAHDDRKLLAFPKEIDREISLLEASLDSYLLKSRKKEHTSPGALGVDWLVFGRAAANAQQAQDDAWARYPEVRTSREVRARRRWLAIKLLEDDHDVVQSWNLPEIEAVTSSAVDRLATDDGAPIAARLAAARYANVRKIAAAVVESERNSRLLWSDKADRILTHPFWGLIIFFFAMYCVFWLTFTLGNYPVSWLENLQGMLEEWCNSLWLEHPESLARSLIVDGVIAGVGGVLVFFPNIFILFAAIAVLEESGYMARGAFLTDRFLSRFGLTGKSFIPMLVGFGCSVPAVMSTRIIEDKRARLTTIFVVPLMSCGARYPIYMLLIPAFFPLQWQAPVLWMIYVLGIVLAAIISTTLTKAKFQGETSPMLIELPVYHAPTFHTVGKKALERGMQYLTKAGTTILGVSVLLWALSTFPRLPDSELTAFTEKSAALHAEANDLGIDLEELALVVADEENHESSAFARLAPELRARAEELLEANEQNEFEIQEARLEHSVVGRLGKAMEPVIKFAGMDWRIGSALVGAFAAKEVFVAQMGIVFKVGAVDETSDSLREILHEKYTPLVAVAIILFCLIGAPCMATLVVVAKEASWSWAWFQWATLTVLGFLVACAVYQIGSHCGWGV